MDDEPVVRTMVARLLTDAGFRVLTAMSGWEALERLKGSGTIQVLLTDLRMPLMSGVQLAEQVRDRYPDCRVVVMAAYPSDEVLVWPVVVKPFPAGVLEAEIRRAVMAPDARTSRAE